MGTTNICNKASSTLGFLKRNLNISSKSVKVQAYKSLVRPSLEYACTIWDPYIQQDIDNLERAQRRAARYVCNKYRNTSSVTDMLQHLEWEPLSTRRKNSRLTMLYKIANNHVVIPHTNRLIPQNRQTRHNNSNSYQIPQCRSEYRKQSFFPRTIKEWNTLPESVIKSDTVDSFKRALSELK